MSNFIPVASPALGGNELEYVKRCVKTNWISSQGQFVNQFEEEFSSYIGTQFGVATSNGTTALHLALEALGIKENDEVIVPDLTFVATINAVLYTGATPVLVDIDKDSWNIDYKKIESKINRKTKAIIPVHLYGQPCNMEKIMEIANKYNLYVIEDCAEAHGAEYKGKKVGSFGDISCFSFFGNKIITTGEGGMCLTNNQELKEKMRIIRDHGMDPQKRYWHKKIGYNYRMTNLQAAIGVAQLERIEEILGKRETIVKIYDSYLKGVKGITLQKNFKDRKRVCWIYTILIEENKYGINRDELRDNLRKNNIETRPLFYPLHEMDIYIKYCINNDLRLSSKISEKGISLPTLLNMDDDTIRRICELIIC
ncbi:DegT/DnrJ/EryC1/StrS family aminotransferase [Halocella sp. SP3-1]|uniref:DegT/DnrJ/EryC1/StrS family aminotransferase n=1 Tax=Halocella sp. SP3-1 TaxID=2382161 RepID=UPI000F750514|nr:DegT/DnrJ/EryC1/StrS family aminotransferase [Halocella sp. SP3-1]AZO94020.1 DegT/DnrJ/EryC1/StrS family aminotransferase [Halocella sp. SP3-1]